MEKQGAVHIHGLLALVRRELTNRAEVPEGAFRAYDENGVYHRSIHRRKSEHEEAIWLLSEGIRETLAAESREAEPPAA